MDVIRPALAMAAAAGAAQPGVPVDGSRWRFVEEAGAWWLVPPAGGRMLSIGVDCVGPGPDGEAFSPAKPEYSAALRGGEAYGPWERRTLERMRAWGFNTAGGWCHGRFQKAGLPYTPVLHLGVQLGAPWGDPWHPELPSRAKELARTLTAETRGDPNRIGYFLDNEFGWGDDYLLGLALGWAGDAPGKAKLVETLRETYRGDFGAFRRDFDGPAADWEELLRATATAPRPGCGHRVLDAWTYAVARRYNEVLVAAVREADPGALILGDRYRQFYPQAVARAARGVLDAVSTNYEATTPDGWIPPAYFASLHALSGLPVLIGEFYATARRNRSGNRNHGGEFTLVDTQAQRAAAAAAQARAFAAFPFVAGWHWFQWCDEPTYGRSDGEDYNMGLVDIYDVLYVEMTRAFAAEHAAAAAAHAKAGEASRAAAHRGPLAVGRQEGLVADGSLTEWRKDALLPGRFLACEAPLAPFGDVLLAWDPAALWIAVRAYDFSIPAKNAPESADPATWGDLHRLTVSVEGVTVRAAAGLTAAKEAKEEAWKQVVFSLPPPRGVESAAIAAKVGRWYYVWEVAIPASALGPEPLAPGRKLSLSLVVENRGDFEKMRADTVPIVLSDTVTPRAD